MHHFTYHDAQAWIDILARVVTGGFAVASAWNSWRSKVHSKRASEKLDRNSTELCKIHKAVNGHIGTPEKVGETTLEDDDCQ